MSITTDGDFVLGVGLVAACGPLTVPDTMAIAIVQARSSMGVLAYVRVAGNRPGTAPRRRTLTAPVLAGLGVDPAGDLLGRSLGSATVAAADSPVLHATPCSVLAADPIGLVHAPLTRSGRRRAYDKIGPTPWLEAHARG